MLGIDGDKAVVQPRDIEFIAEAGTRAQRKRLGEELSGPGLLPRVARDEAKSKQSGRELGIQFDRSFKKWNGGFIPFFLL